MDKHENELFSSFALNSLNDDEREEALRHAQASEGARRELDAMQETAALLSLGAPLVEPPERLKANIMDAIRNVEQLPPETRREAPAPAASPTVKDTRRSQRFFALAAGILLIAAGALGALAWNLNTQQQELNRQLDAMTAQQDAMTRILGSSDMRSKTQTLEDGATVTLSYSASSGLMAVSTAGMPELPEGKGYELWLISGEGATPAGMLDAAGADGMKMIKAPMDGITHFGITVEPASGSPAPTTEPIMLQGL